MEDGQRNQNEGGVPPPGGSPSTAQPFPHSAFYDHLLASNFNVPSNNANEPDTFPHWSAYGAHNTGLPMGYGSWASLASNPNFANYAADTFATSGHLPTTNQFSTGIDYLSSLSQPDSAESESSYPSAYSGGLEGLDFNQAASNGRDLYADAYQQWAAPPPPIPTSEGASTFTGKTYDPFGSTDMFTVDSQVYSNQGLTNNANPSPVEKPQPPQIQKPEPIQQPIQQSRTVPTPPQTLEPVETQKPATHVRTKPSYSEVAKHKLSVKSTIKKEEVHKEVSSSIDSSRPHATAAPTGAPPQKSKKSRSRRSSHSSRNRSVPMEPAPIRPDSRYGLDTFDEPPLREKLHQRACTSSESSRKGSFSSVGSGSSGVEEVTLPLEKPLHTSEKKSVNVYDMQGPGPGSGVKYNSKTGEFISEKVLNESEAKEMPKPQETTKQKSSAKHVDEDPFFDPRRIFNRKEKKPTNNKTFIPNNQQNLRKDEEENLLNSGKTKSNLKSSSARYINNDLRDSKKQTNTESRNASFGPAVSESCKPKENKATSTQPKSKRSDHISGSSKKSTSTMTDEAVKPNLKKIKKDRSVDVKQVVGVWLQQSWDWLVWGGKHLLHLLANLTKLCISVSLLFMSMVWHYAVRATNTATEYLCVKLPFLRRYLGRASEGQWYANGSSNSGKQRTFGLKENIALPSTGEEAMKRLLSCKGKDPYSILGVKADATDEEIKKYYRRQAVLVHPDKNQQPGAEEAFKILGHAIELIGEPEKRRQYDTQRTEAQETEAAMHEFADLLTKLHDKMQEASNMMRCEHCGGKHKRVLTEWPAYSARFCSRCNTRHPAKEGDVWAESSMLGFLWHYFACMEGKVYDITEWASCQHESFKCMQANAHQVIYRISTGAGRQRTNSSRTGEAELEDFLSNLFHHSGGTSPGGAQGAPPGHHQGWAGAQAPSAGATSGGQQGGKSGGGGGGRRRKKRR